MKLSAGTRLGHYEILAPIGAGGMGEVYKAKDTRLDRTVAIKVLPSHLADNARLRERFEREARAVSALNHPHICTLYDVGKEDGTDFLVMEYIEGQTLADRLKKGALPFEEALRYGAQMADALDKAHREGVVHRDVKPGNVMLTESGIKLLDFGLATRLRQGFAGARTDEDSEVATEQRPLTEEGAVLGTFQYMAPEQLEGEDADPRTDIFALGAVLYEMVSGRKAFEGESQASLITAIMSRVAAAACGASAHVPSVARSPGEPMSGQGGRETLAKRRGPEARAVVASRFESDGSGCASHDIGWGKDAVAPSRLAGSTSCVFRATPFQERNPAFSPDGPWLAYVSDESGRDEVYVRPYPGPGGKFSISIEGGIQPVWSPAGGELFYREGDKMMVVAVEKGPAFRSSKPKVLFEGPFATGFLHNPNYTVSPDGQRFVMIQEIQLPHFEIVLNWANGLER